MNLKFCLFACFWLFIVKMQALNFENYFENASLRIDYVFSGTAEKQEVSLAGLCRLPGWYGRGRNLPDLLYAGDVQLQVYDLQSDLLLYSTSFNTLFQEWLTTPQARKMNRSFEHPCLIPYPKKKVRIVLKFRSRAGTYIKTSDFVVDPSDILIRRRGYSVRNPYLYVHTGDTVRYKCINVAIVSEGYTDKEMKTFYSDAAEAAGNILSYEPFKSQSCRFNFIAVFTKSRESGVSIPAENIWKNTVFESHYSTFYSDRYLTSQKMETIHNALAGIPYEHIIVLVNTPKYGGGGFFNMCTFASAHHPTFKQVITHEFGHDFAGLADEYAYDEDVLDSTYDIRVEPWEPNITTLTDFSSKWQKMLKKNTPVPTDPSLSGEYPVGVYEGAAYLKKGMFRPSPDCRMRSNETPEFCEVCKKAILDTIDFYSYPK